MFSADLQNRAYDTIASTSFGRRGALWLRNVATQVLGHRLASTIDPDVNGETLLLTTLAPGLRTVLDIGANTGEWTQRVLAAAPAVERILCYEPGSEALAALQNRFDDPRIEVVEAAVSGTAGEHEFFEVPGAGETSSLITVERSTPQLLRTVHVVTVDDELARLEISHVDLLKIDVEGMDLHVLTGAARALAAHRIDVIQFEYGERWAAAGSTLAAAFRLLRGHGYEVYALLSDGLHDFEPEGVGELYVYSNFVALLPGAQTRVRPTRLGTF